MTAIRFIRARKGTFCSVSLALCVLAGRLPAQVTLQRVFPEITFDHPVDLQHAGDKRLFVVEQDGIIRVVSPDGRHAGVFLDIRDRVVSGGELGLLGLAFHPQYSSNGLFFVNYTTRSPLRSVVARYRRDPSKEDAADPGSGQVILVVAQPFENHNGGQLAFGPDGFLYIALGDGGSAGDPFGNSQNRTVLLGKLLRIDVDRRTTTTFYGIPPDNPFVGGSGGLRGEIFAFGLRNPWRFSFDRKTGRLWTGDVGQNRMEEINIVEKGGNYGWNIMEGPLCYSPSSGCDTTGLAAPVHSYGRAEGGSITGGYVYRGSSLVSLSGKYVYGDYLSGRIWALDYSGPGAVRNALLLESGLHISSFGEDRDGEIFVCDYDGGRIFKLAVRTGRGSR